MKHELIFHDAVQFSRVNAGFQLGGNGPNALQNNNMLMTVIIGLGVISFLQIVTNVVSPFLGKKKDTAAAAAATGSTATNSTTPTTTPAPATAASARSLSDMVDLAEHVLKAIEAIGEDMKHE